MVPRRAPAAPLPDGFAYRPDFFAPDEEQALVAELEKLPFREFEFHGYLGRRRVVSFGWRYEFGSGLQAAEPMPEFLWPVRERAAALAGVVPADLEHALLTEYRPGAPGLAAQHPGGRAAPLFDHVADVAAGPGAQDIVCDARRHDLITRRRRGERR